MKYVLPLILLGMILVMPACQNSEAYEGIDETTHVANSINGGWELINSETGDVMQLKVFSDDHFSYVHRTNEGTFAGASSGSYRLEGDKYIETHFYSSDERFMERAPGTFTWNFEVRGDSLFMSGPTSCIDKDGKSLEDLYGICKADNSISESRVRAKK